ncbi:glycosyltransferase family 25 protein [Hymenobacter siberiensis]|jgi:glycosyl transferase family 25|uniref:glycosyltransferase family 25 protein n=1 Tax=Hymenobacter siberiensis TaxID=2848396 RepID=UPI001C1E0311|nr:glycosyltransferase family 25 protein [Hymenobacter siberiensis]MBU6122871.1 glycosyltransferase family 25 protein [Hymenobacter siberiensis]
MKIFVVSLSRIEARTKYIKAHLDALKVDYELIDAVDYINLTPADFDVMSDQEAVRQNPFLTKGVIACSLSHVKIYKHIVANNVGVSLVIEDDAALPKNIKKILDIVEREIKDDEIISLSYFNHHQAKDTTDMSKYERKPVGEGCELVYPVDLQEIASSMAYVITKKVAERMIDVLMPIWVQTDYWGNYYEKHGFGSFRCLYPVQVLAAPIRSSIEYDSAKTLTSRVASLVRKYKVPVLMSYLEKRASKIQGEKYHFQFVDRPPFNKAQ